LLKGSFVNFVADMGASHHVGIHESDDKSGYTSIDLPRQWPRDTQDRYPAFGASGDLSRVPSTQSSIFRHSSGSACALQCRVFLPYDNLSGRLAHPT
jgi:hypothetical protein